MCTEEEREDAGWERAVEGLVRKDVPEVVEIAWLRVSSMVSGVDDRAIVTMVFIGGREQVWRGELGETSSVAGGGKGHGLVAKEKLASSRRRDQCAPRRRAVRDAGAGQEMVFAGMQGLVVVGMLEQDAQECAKDDGRQRQEQLARSQARRPWLPLSGQQRSFSHFRRAQTVTQLQRQQK